MDIQGEKILQADRDTVSPGSPAMTHDTSAYGLWFLVALPKGPLETYLGY